MVPAGRAASPGSVDSRGRRELGRVLWRPMVMRNTTALLALMLAVAVWAAACGSSEPDAVIGAAPAEEPSQPADQVPVEDDQADGSAADGGEVSDSDDGAASGSDESDDSDSAGGEDYGASSSSSSDDAEASSGAAGDEDSGANAASSSDDADSSSGASGEDYGASGEDSGASSSSSSDDAAASSGSSGEDSGASSSSSSDDAAASSGSSGEDSGASSSSSSDDAAASSGSSGEDSGASSSSSSDDAAASSSASSDADAPGSLDDTVSVSSDQIVGDGADITDPGPSTSGGPAPPQERRELARITGVVMQVLESWPAQVIVEVSGELPDPCHELWWEVAVDGNTYDLKVWSVSPPPDSDLVCAMMIQSFVENVPLGGGFVDEDYTVIVNGEVHELNF